MARTAAVKKERKAPDALALLQQDHEDVSAAFDKYVKGKDRTTDAQKGDLAAEICAALTVHMTIEEEIFYPACEGEVPGTDDLLAEALVEHEGVKELIVKIEGREVGSDEYDAQIKVLGEYVKHHVKEEHDDLFPKVRKSKLDIDALGQRMQARMEELHNEPL